jgi:hypothetical protein
VAGELANRRNGDGSHDVANEPLDGCHGCRVEGMAMKVDEVLGEQ